MRQIIETFGDIETDGNGNKRQCCKIRDLIVCADCRFSTVEHHKGDDERVCWVRKSFGEKVPDDGYCHKAKPRGQHENV